MTDALSTNAYTGFNWPLYNAIEKLFREADLPVPSRFEVSRLEVADEDSGLCLVRVVVKLQATSVARAGCIREVLDALDRFRSSHDGQAEPAINVLASKVQQDEKRLDPEAIEKSLGDPDTRRELLVALARGAEAAQVVGSHFDYDLAEDGNWVLAACDADWFRAAVCAAELKRKKRIDLMRRLRKLSQAPSKHGLVKLLWDARKASPMMFGSVISMLRKAAGQVLFKGQDLPSRWLSEVAEDEVKLALVASNAHKRLKSTSRGQGRGRDFRMERYADRVGAAYKRLTGVDIPYCKATYTTSKRKAGQRFGKGLEFMHFALRLANACANEAVAQRQIDRIRHFIKLNDDGFKRRS